MIRKVHICSVARVSQGLEALPHVNYLGAQVIAAGMAPHLTGKEQEQLMEWRRKGCTPIEIHAKLVGCRGGKGIKAPDLTVVRKFLKGKTHRRGGRCRLSAGAVAPTDNRQRRPRPW